MPQRTRPVASAPPTAPPTAHLVPPTARLDRRDIRRASRSRRRAEAAERRRPGSGRRRRAAAVVLAGTAVLLVAVPLVLAFGPIFTVRTIAVTGVSGSTATAVRQALAGQIGRPVATVDDSSVAAALRSVPAVEGFTVVRRPPDLLEVVVVPRTAMAQQAAAGGWQVVDAARVVIASGADRRPDLPVVVVPSGAGSSAAYAAAMSAIRALAGSTPAVTRIRADGPDDAVLTLVGGQRVVWGGADDGPAKAQALHAALRKAARHATEIDVSSPGVVLTR